jgi:uncharacterized membrane protein
VAPGNPNWTWQEVSRAVGLTIVLVLLIVFCIGFFAHVDLDRTITLAFLGIASGLIGLPSGWQLVRRNGGPPK